MTWLYSPIMAAGFGPCPDQGVGSADSRCDDVPGRLPGRGCVPGGGRGERRRDEQETQ